jgi:hypothetical protein
VRDPDADGAELDADSTRSVADPERCSGVAPAEPVAVTAAD